MILPFLSTQAFDLFRPFFSKNYNFHQEISLISLHAKGSQYKKSFDGISLHLCSKSFPIFGELILRPLGYLNFVLLKSLLIMLSSSKTVGKKWEANDISKVIQGVIKVKRIQNSLLFPLYGKNYSKIRIVFSVQVSKIGIPFLVGGGGRAGKIQPVSSFCDLQVVNLKDLTFCSRWARGRSSIDLCQKFELFKFY